MMMTTHDDDDDDDDGDDGDKEVQGSGCWHLVIWGRILRGL